VTPNSPGRSVVTAADAPAAIGPYSHAISHDGLLFCSGQLPLDPESGALIDDSPGAEATKCLENLEAICGRRARAGRAADGLHDPPRCLR
jgi:2-iminobutanoate/2-iminopropanoate deaminase